MVRWPIHAVTPRVALAATVAVSFLAWGLLAELVSIPRWFLDELFYMDAGVSVAQGDGLGFRDQGWGYGPVYPLVVAAFARVTADQELTYALVKAANALCFSFTAVPVYLIARRLLPPWHSVGVAALSVAVPSSVYVSVVMTESLAYPVACCAILAVLLALELPSAVRQLAAVAILALAILVRPQLVALYGGYLLALALVAWVSPSQRRLLLARPLVLWPTALSVLVGVAWLGRSVAAGEGIGGALGSYSVLATSYEPLAVARWLAHSLGGLALYLAVVPVVVAPTVLVRLVRRARAEGDERAAAFVACFVAANLVGLLLVAVFASSDYGHRILHDRYLFFLVPLWLVAFAAWLRDGLPRPAVPFAVGALGTAALVLTLPFGLIGNDSFFDQFEAVGTEVWGKVGVVADRIPLVTTWLVGLVVVAGLIGAAALVPRRRAWILVALVAAGLAVNLVPGWRSAFVDTAVAGAGPRGTRAWVDDRIGTRTPALLMFVARRCTGAERGAFTLTDFFNRSVRDAITIGGEGPAAGVGAYVQADGLVTRADGRPLDARYVVAQPGVGLDGRVLARATPARLALWEVQLPLRVSPVRTQEQLVAGGCPE